MVSVVIPTVDRPDELRRAVSSVLSQRHDGPIECLIVFDGTDPVAPSVPTRPDRTIRLLTNNRTRGLAGNRNTGYLAAGGDWLAACDDDDEWLPGKLAAQLELAARRPDASLISTGLLIHHQGRDRPRIGTPELRLSDLLLDRHQEVHPSSFLIRRDAVLGPAGIGLVDETLPGGYAEDYDWMLRAARTGPVVSVPEPLVRAYWHDSSFFVRRWQTVDDALGALLAKTPEFDDCPPGRARIEAQRAFSRAARGQRRAGAALALRSIRVAPRGRHGWAALLVASGLVGPDRVLSMARRAGRGI